MTFSMNPINVYSFYRINPQNEAAKKGLERLEKQMKVGLVLVPSDLFFSLKTDIQILNKWVLVGGGSGCTRRRGRKWGWWCRCRTRRDWASVGFVSQCVQQILDDSSIIDIFEKKNWWWTKVRLHTLPSEPEIICSKFIMRMREINMQWKFEVSLKSLLDSWPCIFETDYSLVQFCVQIYL